MHDRSDQIQRAVLLQRNAVPSHAYHPTRRCRDLRAVLLQIYVPRMYKEFSSEKVLTMEWVDGVKPRRGSEGGGFGGGSEQDLALVEVGVRCSLEQMLEEGCASTTGRPWPRGLAHSPSCVSHSNREVIFFFLFFQFAAAKRRATTGRRTAQCPGMAQHVACVNDVRGPRVSVAPGAAVSRCARQAEADCRALYPGSHCRTRAGSTTRTRTPGTSCA